MIDKTRTLIDLADKTPRILKVDGTEVPFPPANGTAYTLEEFYKGIGGDGNNDPCITTAGVMDGMMMVAEDNAIAMQLPMNHKATWFYNEMAKRNGWPDPGWPILGNCMIFPAEMME